VIGWRFLRLRTEPAARRLFTTSILYLPLLLALVVADMNGRDSSAEPTAPSSVAFALVIAEPPTGAGGGP
jgi:hypothetical protein